MTTQELQALYKLLYEHQTEIIQLHERIEMMRERIRDLEAMQANHADVSAEL